MGSLLLSANILMWREESGFLEMFLSYYSQFEENVIDKKAYRDFLFDIISAHEEKFAAGLPAQPEYNHDFTAENVDEEPSNVCDFSWSYSLPESNNSVKSEGFGSFEMHRPQVEAVDEGDRISIENSKPEVSVKLEENDMDDDIVAINIADSKDSSLTSYSNPSIIGIVSEPSLTAQPTTSMHSSQLFPEMDTKSQMNLRYECSICNRVFSSAFSLRRHKTVHAGPFSCRLCDRSFSQQSLLQAHESTHMGERRYACHFCEKACKTRSKLSEHMRIHTGERPYVCNVCSKAFKKTSGLLVHKRTHTGERPYVCRFCNKGFIQSGALRSHMRVHSGEKPFICNGCGKTFAQQSSLTVHLKSNGGACLQIMVDS